MFGFSLAELIIVFLVIIIFIKPADLPEIAHFLGKILYRIRHLYSEVKLSLKEIEKEFGVDDLKQEMQRGLAEEKTKLEEEITVIVDMYGNEHRVSNVAEIRSDLSKEDLEKEIANHNKINLDQKPSQP